MNYKNRNNNLHGASTQRRNLRNAATLDYFEQTRRLNSTGFRCGDTLTAVAECEFRLRPEIRLDTLVCNRFHRVSELLRRERLRQYSNPAFFERLDEQRFFRQTRYHEQVIAIDQLLF